MESGRLAEVFIDVGRKMSVDTAEIKGGGSKCNIAIEATKGVPPRKAGGIRGIRGRDDAIKGDFATTRIDDANDSAAFKRSRLGNAEDGISVFHSNKC